jgi:hypothetical protein
LDRKVFTDFAPTRTVINKDPHHKLYIFDFAGTEDELRDAFQEYSENIIDVHLSAYILDFIHRRTTHLSYHAKVKNPQSGESLMAGFVDFASIEKASEALEALNGREIAYGSKLKISYARKPKFQTDREGNERAPYSRHNTTRSYGGDWGGGKRGSDYHGSAARGGGGGGGRGGYRSGNGGGYRGGGGGGGYRSNEGGNESI